jgi:hypothetical protein
MPHVFISYVREDSLAVRRLADDLKAAGVEVWLDRERLLPGVRWEAAIRQAIRQGSFFIACFSAHYAAREKSYMNEELVIAIDELRQRPSNRTWFLPVLLDPDTLPQRAIGGGEYLENLQFVTLHDGWDEGVKRLLAAISTSPPDFSIERASAPQLDIGGRRRSYVPHRMVSMLLRRRWPVVLAVLSLAGVFFGARLVSHIVGSSRSPHHGATSSRTAGRVLVPSIPKKIVGPQITGIARVGESIACSSGKWKGTTPLLFTYSWLRDGVIIAGATRNVYAVSVDDEGRTLACEVTATGPAGKSTAQSSGLPSRR